MAALLIAVALIVFVCLDVVQFALAARPLPENTCENTESGRHYLADSLGYVCHRNEMDYSSGCCASGTLNSCETCHEADHCCSSYEHCVSCCMKPGNDAERLSKEQFRIPKRPETGTWDSPFQYCEGVCRTHQKSTSHENSYIDDRHFCFNLAGRPKTVPAPPSLAQGIVLRKSGRGKDCSKTCSAEGLTCAEREFATINHCDALREHFACEAGCQAVPGKTDAPSYVVYGAPKPSNPAMCFTAAPTTAQTSCAASAVHVERLCPCATSEYQGPSTSRLLRAHWHV